VTGPRAGRARRGPALLVTVAVVWALLALFVLFPLAGLLVRVFVDGGRLSFAGTTLLVDPNQLRAFWNSLLLAALVGAAGTVLGFLFALTATRAGVGRRWLGVLDAATLLPLATRRTLRSAGRYLVARTRLLHYLNDAAAAARSSDVIRTR
jgi:ABC-type Fe3+ transport system permease subunit